MSTNLPVTPPPRAPRTLPDGCRELIDAMVFGIGAPGIPMPAREAARALGLPLEAWVQQTRSAAFRAALREACVIRRELEEPANIRVAIEIRDGRGQSPGARLRAAEFLRGEEKAAAIRLSLQQNTVINGELVTPGYVIKLDASEAVTIEHDPGETGA